MAPDSSPAIPTITYSVGGTVQASGGYYVERSADGELLDLCLKGEFAYVLTSRQMGKSSLMIRTAETLRQRKDTKADQTVPVIVDLTGLGTPGDQETWYRGFLLEVVRKLDQELKLRGEAELVPQLLQWWQRQAEAGMGVTQRFTQFFADVILAQVRGRVVVFVDEIDTTLSLAYTDDFFIAIRYFFTSRAENPAFKRLSFVLLGVATPGDLIIDSRRTPFNIGRRVELTDFTLAEAAPLKEGLGLEPQQAEAVFEQVWAWTGGHPYLTQRSCGALQSRGGSVPLLGGVRGGLAVDPEGLTHPPAHSQEGEIDPLVQRLFLGEGSEKDNNLQFVRDMLTLRAPGEDVLGVLQVYRQIWRGREVLDEEQSLVKNHLKLSGLVKRQGQRLVVRNRVYQQVFDETWLRKYWPLNWMGQLKLAWKVVAASVGVTLVVGGLGLWAYDQSRQLRVALANVEVARQEAETQAKIAQENAAEAEAQRRIAEDNATQAAQQATLAQENAAEAKKQAKLALENEAIAEENAAEASLQATLAEERQRVAETAQRDAEQQRIAAERAGIKAEYQSEVARLREQAAVVLNWLPTRRAPQGMALALQTYVSGKNKDVAVPVLKVAESSLLSAVQRMKESHKLLGHEGPVSAVAFSPVGDRIVSGSSDGTLRLWDVQGNPIGEPFQGHTSSVLSVAFSP
ncbi:MAG: AAA-like domain-containing protein, partial [Prochlorotrichaceae cyanobacterium]